MLCSRIVSYSRVVSRCSKYHQAQGPAGNTLHAPKIEGFLLELKLCDVDLCKFDEVLLIFEFVFVRGGGCVVCSFLDLQL